MVTKTMTRGMSRKRVRKSKSRFTRSMPVKVARLSKSVRYLNKVVKADIDVCDTNATSAVSTVGNVVLLNQIALGDDEGNRDGTTVMIRSLLMRLSVIAADTTNFIRWIVVQDTQAVGGTALSSIGQFLDGTPTYQSPLIWTSRGRFKVWYDRTFAVSNVWQPNLTDKIYIKFPKPIEATYVPNGASNAVDKNAFYVVQLTDSGAVPHPSCIYDSRIVYHQ